MELNHVSQSGDGQTARSQSNLVGYALLFGIVAIGSISVFVLGGAALDSVNDELTTEQVESTMDVIDSELETAVLSGQTHSLPHTEYGQLEAIDDGTVSVEWHNETGTVSAEQTDLGALRLEGASTTLVHQGGGIWRDDDSGVGTYKEPGVGIDDDGSLRFDLVQFPQIDHGTLPSTAARSGGQTDGIDAIGSVLETPDAENLTIEIESEYAEGWYRHLRSELDGSTISNADLDQHGDTVSLSLYNVGELPAFYTIADPELTANNGSSLGHVITGSNPYNVDAVLENAGDNSGSVLVTIDIYNRSDTVIDSTTFGNKSPLFPSQPVQLDDQNDWEFAGNQFDGSDLEPGYRYEYDIDVTPGESLTERSSFYYVAADPSYTVTETSVNETDSETTLSGIIQNIGANATDGQPVTLEVSPADNDEVVTTSQNVTLDELGEKTVNWDLDNDNWTDGTYEYTVRTAHDPDGTSGTFDIDSGGDFLITEDLGIPEEHLQSGSPGQIVSEGETTITVEANISSTYADDRSQSVTLTLENESEPHEETDLELESGEQDDVSLEIDISDLEPGAYEYRIATESDELNEPGTFFVDGDGPELVIDGPDNGAPEVDDSVRPGDPLTVDVELTNEGDDGNQSVTLEFDGEVLDFSQFEDLEPGETVDTTLEWGSVDSVEQNTAELTVRTQHDGADITIDLEPLFEIESTAMNQDYVGPNETATIDVDLRNVGGAGERTVETAWDAFELSLDPGETHDGTLEARAGERTESISIETGDDQALERILVNRGAPDCDEVDYAGGSGDESDPYQISTIDQLQCIGEGDHLDGHHWELTNDIDAHGTQYWDGTWDPIGNDVSSDQEWDWGCECRLYGHDDEFKGQFDGNGHKIEGLHIVRPDDDLVGLFGATHRRGDGGGNSRIENLRLEDVYVHGSDRVGGIAGMMGGRIEQSSVTGYVEAENQRVGLVVGRGEGADLTGQLSARGEVVGDSASSFDRGVGSIVGRTSYDTDFDTSYAVADLTAPGNVGGLMGSSSSNPSTFSNMYAANDVSGAPSGAITGIVEDSSDVFTDSVYWDQEVEAEPYGDTDGGSGFTDDWQPRDTDQMQGPSVLPDPDDGHDFSQYEGIDDAAAFFDQYPGVTAEDAEGTMANLDWDIWEPVYEINATTGEIEHEGYPQFAWEAKAQGVFEVEITNEAELASEILPGERVVVEADVTSTFRDEQETTQPITLVDPEGSVADSRSVTLDGTPGVDDNTSVELIWQTDTDTAEGSTDITVRSQSAADTASVTIGSGAFTPGSSGGLSPGTFSRSNSSVNDPIDPDSGLSGGDPLRPLSGITVDVAAIRLE